MAGPPFQRTFWFGTLWREWSRGGGVRSGTERAGRSDPPGEAGAEHGVGARQPADLQAEGEVALFEAEPEGRVAADRGAAIEEEPGADQRLEVGAPAGRHAQAEVERDSGSRRGGHHQPAEAAFDGDVARKAAF